MLIKKLESYLKNMKHLIMHVIHQSCQILGLSLSSFNGNIYDYPQFKSDFIKQELLQINNQGSAAYALKSCLGGIPYDWIKNVHENLDQIW